MARSKSTFKPGVSGNKAGRPPGKTGRAQFRAAMAPYIPGILEKLGKAADAGDLQAIRIVSDKLFPNLRPTSDDVNIKAVGSPAERAEAIVNAMVSGRMSPETAKTAIEVLTAQSALTSVKENNRLLQELESWKAIFEKQRS